MMFKKVVLILIFLSLQKVGLAQERPANYFKNSIDGYVHLYFDHQYFLVDEDCSFKTFTRVIKYDEGAGGFNSFFIDYYNNNATALTGKYVNGNKEGVFKQFYPNGTPQSLSEFENNLPVGEWIYFYPSGNPWIVVKYKNAVPYIMEYWNEKGVKKVKSGKGRYQSKQEIFDFNEYGYSGTLAMGRLNEGRPIGAWSNYLDFPETGNQWIGGEIFSKNGFKKSMYIFPTNLAKNTSIIQLLPSQLWDNSAVLKYKNCTIDDQKLFNLYLQNYINAALPNIWQFDEVPLENSFTATVNINQFGQSISVQISENVPKEFGFALQYALKSVTYWIPSFIKGKTVEDSLEITFFKQINEDGVVSFNYPKIKRKNENLSN